MTTLSIRDFRSNLAASLDRVDNGEQVLVRRGNKVYTIIVVDDQELEFSPQLVEKIDRARAEFKSGETLAFENAAAAQQWMDEL
ncbi:MAG: type II toxin-antitoxin system Phd/YefM family antitoxin [Muribaculaceae bacterium]|nr:type II toxin-antitoxin system Phd/YefM family antitoxin [Muribaculaceae bacterium]